MFNLCWHWMWSSGAGKENLECSWTQGNLEMWWKARECSIIRFREKPCLEVRCKSLIVKACHERVYHNGVKETLTQLLSRFWIVWGRQVVKKTLHGCTLCHRLQEKPYSPANPPALPLFRITKGQPFTYTGVDLAGPVYIKENGDMLNT